MTKQELLKKVPLRVPLPGGGHWAGRVGLLRFHCVWEAMTAIGELKFQPNEAKSMLTLWLRMLLPELKVGPEWTVWQIADVIRGAQDAFRQRIEGRRETIWN